jgi:hypothetical protein
MHRFLSLYLLPFAAASGIWPALGEPLSTDRQIAIRGAALLVQAVDFHPASIVLSVAIANPTDREIRLNQGRALVLDDEAHGHHHLNPPADNPELSIPPRSRLTGELVFIGPLAPSVRQLTLAANGGSAGDQTTGAATLSVEDRGGPADAYQADLSGGVSLRIGRITAGGTGCAARLLATNGDDRTIVLNPDRRLVLADANGHSAPLRVPPENRELVVPAGNRLDADLVFDCRSLDTDGAVTLTNRAAGNSRDDGATPVFSLTPPVEHEADPVLSTASKAVVAPIAWSHLSEPTPPTASGSAYDAARPPAAPAPKQTASTDPPPPTAAVSRDVAQLATALRAKRTERGLRLALPAKTLFGAAPDALATAADPLLQQLAALIAASQMRQVVVTVYGGPATRDSAVDTLTKRRSEALVAWLEQHAPPPRPHFTAKAGAARAPGAPKHDPGDPGSASDARSEPWVDVILRRDYLVPNSRSPASPNPGKM